MKLLTLLFASAMLVMACSSPKTTTTTVKTSESRHAAHDTVQIEYYETEFDVRQKDYLAQLTGSWTVNTMQRQARLPEENLSGVSLQLNSDKTFSAKLSCGDISGNFSLKGTSIRFQDIRGASCDGDEQMTALLKLLTGTVSAYTVDNNSLLLRDGSSNIVFRGSKVY